MAKTMIFVYGLMVSFLGFLLIWLVWYFWKAHNRSEIDLLASPRLRRKAGEEDRKSLRADVNWSVSMETSDGIIAAEAKNISLGGAFICCEKPLPIGENFQLTMTVPDNKPISATAKVVWSNINVPSEKVINRGMGVRFLKVSEQHIRLVRQILKKGD